MSGAAVVTDLLLDSDVFVDHLRGHRQIRPGRDRFFYSTVTRAELFAGRGTDEAVVTQLLAPFGEIVVDRAIAERAGRLRRGRSITMPDALIAATALEGELTLMTGNRRDFGGIRGLSLRSRRGSA